MFVITADFVDGKESNYQELNADEVTKFILDNYIEFDNEGIAAVDAECWLTIQPDLETGKKALFKRWMDYVEDRILDSMEWFGEYNTDNNPETIRKKMTELGKSVLDHCELTTDLRI